jgi:hypothetical protein
MITIRRYNESDAVSVGKLIADAFSEFDLYRLCPLQLRQKAAEPEQEV